MNGLLERKQKMSLQNKVDYYLVLKDIRKLHDADSLRTVLFEQTPFEKLTDKECWSLFSEEVYGSQYFEYVVKHGDKFREKQGKERIDDYLFKAINKKFSV